MTRFVFFLALVISSFAVRAATSGNVQTLKLMMPKVCHFSGEFSQTKQIKTLPVPLVSNGEFLYSCDLGLIWKTHNPVTESLVFTNQKLNFVVPEKRLVENLDGVQHDFLANLLLGLMAGNTDFIAEEFEIEDIKNTASIKQLTLIPKHKMVKKAIDSVVLKKTTSKNELQIAITDKNQQVTRIVSTEKQRYSQHDDFSKRCHALSSEACTLLLDPVRITRSGQN